MGHEKCKQICGWSTTGTENNSDEISVYDVITYISQCLSYIEYA